MNSAIDRPVDLDALDNSTLVHVLDRKRGEWAYSLGILGFTVSDSSSVCDVLDDGLRYDDFICIRMTPVIHEHGYPYSLLHQAMHKKSPLQAKTTYQVARRRENTSRTSPSSFFSRALEVRVDSYPRSVFSLSYILHIP